MFESTVLWIVVLVFCAYKIINGVQRLWMIRDIPGPKSIPIIGNFLIMHQPLEKLYDVVMQIGAECGPIVKITGGLTYIVAIASPEDVEIIISGMKNLKKNFMYDCVKAWLKEGLFTSPVKKWRTRRKMIAPVFNINLLKRSALDLIEFSEDLVQEIGNSSGKSVDVVPLTAKYIFLSICETMLSTKIDPVGVEEYRHALHKMDEIVVHRFQRPWFYSPILYLFSPMFYQRLLIARWLRNYTLKIIKNRKRIFNSETFSNTSVDEDVDTDSGCKDKKRLSFLDTLLSANTRHEIDMNGIQEEVDTVVFAGYDTTTCSLSFTLMLLACNRDVQDKAVEELYELLPSKEDKPTFNIINNMKYLERVIKESLRLYPPAAFMGRETSETIRTHGGYTIPIGTQVFICPFAMHRNPKIYPEPEKFDPDRFLPEQVKSRHSYAYLPFSAGPRNCVGQKYALMEMKIFVSAILRNFEILPVDTPNTIVLVPGMILCTKNGIRVKFVPRSNK